MSKKGIKREVVTTEGVRQLFLSRGLQMISNEYKNNFLPIEYKCLDRGHEHSMSWKSFRLGSGCLTCSGQAPPTLEQREQAFKERGWHLLSKEYKNKRSPLKFQCSKGHQWQVSWENLAALKGCVNCTGNKKPISFEVLSFECEARGYKLLGKFDNILSRDMMKFTCSNGHTGSMLVNNFRRRSGCQSCSVTGFDRSKAGTLYYIRFEHQGNFYYKIGITNLTIKKRFNGEKTPYIIIWQLKYDDGDRAYQKEKLILKKYSDRIYKGVPFLKNGNSELFDSDVLDWDKPETRDLLNLLSA